MSLEAILEAIRSAGQAQVDEIEAQAAIQAGKIFDKANQEAQQLREQACVSEVVPAIRERSRILQRARLEALRLQGDAREQLVETALEEARKRLESFREESSYARVLGSLVKQAIEELERSADDCAGVSLDADPRDQKLMEGILSATGQTRLVQYELSCWGGVIARSCDGKVVVINTLEARLQRAMPYLRRCLGAFFEEGQPEGILERTPQPATPG